MYTLELNTSIKVAKKAARLLMDLYVPGVEVEHKGIIDLVTEADRRSEKIIIDALRKTFPDDDILTEESNTHRTTSDRRWIIDPLDGTTNYAHRFPVWCVSIAFEHRGSIETGMVYYPCLNELFTARRGHGAFLNGSRIKVSARRKLSDSLLATGFPYDVHTSKDDNIGRFRRFIKIAQAIRRPGSAAIDLIYVACGRFDGFWERNLNRGTWRPRVSW